MRPRPLLVGLTNPYDGEALAPEPIGCAGHRLYVMIRDSFFPDLPYFPADYLRDFDRTNVDDQDFHEKLEAAKRRGATVVVLGQEAWRSLGFNWRHKVRAVDGIVYHHVPHSSGRNHFYNDEQNRRAVGELLRGLIACG